MAKASNNITTERELDDRLHELQQQKFARGLKTQQRQIQFDIGFLVFVLVLVLAGASLPVMPAQAADAVGGYIDSAWEFVPVVFIMLAFGRVMTYVLTRSYQSA